jgi:hypothetical protein
MFEQKINMDLRKEYQQYLDQQYTEEEKEKDPSLKYRITSLYNINGSISTCFEMYMRPYVDKEEEDLRGSTLAELRADLTNPLAHSLESDGVSILNSSMLMFSKIKHLIKRASSISKGGIMYDIFKVVKNTVGKYIGQVGEAFKKDQKSLMKKNEEEFIKRACVYLNTIDYIKETLESVADLIITLVVPPFTDQIEFNSEEELSLGILNEIVNGIKKMAETRIDSVISDFMARISWDRYEQGISEASPYVMEITKRLNQIIGAVKGNIGDVYMTKLLNNICQSTNNKFIGAVLKMKKISDMGIQQLLCGILCFDSNRLHRAEECHDELGH